MKKSEFLQYLQTYGSQINKWPSKLQAQATFMANDTQLRRNIEEEIKLDQWLDDYHVPNADDVFQAQIMRSINADIMQQKPSIMRFLVPATMMACIFVVGFISGLYQPSSDMLNYDDIIEVAMFEVVSEE